MSSCNKINNVNVICLAAELDEEQLSAFTPNEKVKYSPRAGGLECQLIINIPADNTTVTEMVDKAEIYTVD
jgi:hypothetical protein